MHLCGIIKPHAREKSTEILVALKDAGMIVCRAKKITYTAELVEILYDHMSAEARSDIASRYIGLEALALLVSVKSIEEFLEVIGKESDPRLCVKGTIRARFGIHCDASRVGSEQWFENAFHRPIDAREAVRDLRCIWDL
jgi:nucleoside diphosphate kinase